MIMFVYMSMHVVMYACVCVNVRARKHVHYLPMYKYECIYLRVVKLPLTRIVNKLYLIKLWCCCCFCCFCCFCCCCWCFCCYCCSCCLTLCLIDVTICADLFYNHSFHVKVWVRTYTILNKIDLWHLRLNTSFEVSKWFLRTTLCEIKRYVCSK